MIWDGQSKVQKVDIPLEMTYFSNSWILLHFMGFKMFQILQKIHLLGRHIC